MTAALAELASLAAWRFGLGWAEAYWVVALGIVVVALVGSEWRTKQ